ncbi:tetratricopeptide repeat protein [Thalassomonas sp. M1454]|uniref:tetratricopeptide repeat protein n=1 Tax=Thalassomonas sp. M1454 TaxID=2594477 RepID=UPI00117E2F45|nr:tetratricopeptide repeat protein [Thalassomonas sp. M1454]TRX56875.1 tetratricopeptide repeat protein [Thalassomonas sp. M1454]
MYRCKIFILIFVSCLCFSCSNTALPPVIAEENYQPDDLRADQFFITHQQYELVEPDDIFALDEEMTKFVHGKLNRIKDPYARSKTLLTKLFNQSAGALQYNKGANLTAIQAYHQNTANCLSLTILAYTLANEAGLTVKFQQIEIPEYWVREGSYNMLTGHVNMKITGDSKSPFRVIWGKNDLIIDFDPYSTRHYFNKKIISKERVVAMFYNNRGANAIVNKEFDLAYAYFKKSTLIDPQYSSAWANLGLLYKNIGEFQLAESSYKYAISLNSKNHNAWNNLAILYQTIDNNNQAYDIYNYLNKVRLHNPFYHALLGEESFYRGDYEQSIVHYNKAKQMNPLEHEFYFGLAKAYYKLGKFKKSESFLVKAKQRAPFKDIEEKYSNKLNLLTRL